MRGSRAMRHFTSTESLVRRGVTRVQMMTRSCSGSPLATPCLKLGRGHHWPPPEPRNVPSAGNRARRRAPRPASDAATTNPRRESSFTTPSSPTADWPNFGGRGGCQPAITVNLRVRESRQRAGCDAGCRSRPGGARRPGIPDRARRIPARIRVGRRRWRRNGLR